MINTISKEKSRYSHLFQYVNSKFCFHIMLTKQVNHFHKNDYKSCQFPQASILKCDTCCKGEGTISMNIA